jgi:hypothetical protein
MNHFQMGLLQMYRSLASFGNATETNRDVTPARADDKTNENGEKVKRDGNIKGNGEKVKGDGENLKAERWQIVVGLVAR